MWQQTAISRLTVRIAFEQNYGRKKADLDGEMMEGLRSTQLEESNCLIRIKSFSNSVLQ